jgi:predicted LPLAT superfamily acyltransferase
MSTDADPQSARSWSTTPERSNLLAIQTIAWIATHLGRHVARLVLHPIALYYLLFAPAARRASRRYLGRALGRPAGWTDLYRHIHAFASVALDRVWFAAGRVDLFDLRISGGAVMETALAEGRGVYLVGAHIGSFEALHAVGLSKRQLPVAMVMYPENARMIHTVLQALAPDFDVSIIPIGQRGGNRYDVRFEELADFRQPPADPGEREALVLAAVADYVRRLEALCLEAPYNWFNFYDYWHEDAAA